MAEEMKLVSNSPLDLQVIEKLPEHERNQLFAVAELRLLGLFEPSIDE